MKKQSFLDVAISDTSAYKGYKGQLGKFISSKGDTIDDMFTEAFIASTDDDSVYHELSIVGYMQTVMDKACWNARKLFNANNRVSTISGVDPSERTAELVGVVASNKVIKSIIENDYKELLELHAALLQAVSNDLPMDLFYFAPSEPDEVGDWHQRCACESFDDAFTEMNSISDDLDDKKKDLIRANMLKLRADRKAA